MTELNKEAQDQIACVMLRSGNETQVRQAIEYASDNLSGASAQQPFMFVDSYDIFLDPNYRFLNLQGDVALLSMEQLSERVARIFYKVTVHTASSEPLLTKVEFMMVRERRRRMPNDFVFLGHASVPHEEPLAWFKSGQDKKAPLFIFYRTKVVTPEENQ